MNWYVTNYEPEIMFIKSIINVFTIKFSRFESIFSIFSFCAAVGHTVNNGLETRQSN